MRLIMIRHGEPDYAHDCLTETGRLQAAAAAERLAGEGISAIFSSPNGRARETASFTAERLGLPISVLDYMHEISWGGPDVPESGHPWTLAEWMIDREDFDFSILDWKQHPYYVSNSATRDYEWVSGQFDAFLRGRGYRHEGSRFLCETDKEETIALFSHGGSGACVLSSLLNLPFPYVCTVLPYAFTSVTILNFPVRQGAYVHPRLELFNDDAHIHGKEHSVIFQQESE